MHFKYEHSTNINIIQIWITSQFYQLRNLNNLPMQTFLQFEHTKIETPFECAHFKISIIYTTALGNMTKNAYLWHMITTKIWKNPKQSFQTLLSLIENIPNLHTKFRKRTDITNSITLTWPTFRIVVLRSFEWISNMSIQ